MNFRVYHKEADDESLHFFIPIREENEGVKDLEQFRNVAVHAHKICKRAITPKRKLEFLRKRN